MNKSKDRTTENLEDTEHRLLVYQLLRSMTTGVRFRTKWFNLHRSPPADWRPSLCRSAQRERLAFKRDQCRGFAHGYLAAADSRIGSAPCSACPPWLNLSLLTPLTLAAGTVNLAIYLS